MWKSKVRGLSFCRVRVGTVRSRALGRSSNASSLVEVERSGHPRGARASVLRSRHALQGYLEERGAALWRRGSGSLCPSEALIISV